MVIRRPRASLKTLKVEDAYVMEYETFEEVAAGLPRFIEAYNERRLPSCRVPPRRNIIEAISASVTGPRLSGLP